MSKKILFVCTGNTCRSPLAEGFANAEFQRRNLNYTAESAGLAADEGGANEKSVLVAAEYGVDISRHKARQLTVEMAEEAERIYTMTPAQAYLLRQRLGNKKILPLTDDGIQDPFGGSEETYRQCAKEIYKAIQTIGEELYGIEACR
ncbi:MAG: low molecular weight protein arginine phosphatase [Clostridia bacterium]|nr:low molecular weight protein arginine phosphatase [Clostridia bacterium]